MRRPVKILVFALLLMPSTLPGQAAPAGEPLSHDSRLAVKVTLARSDEPLGELLPALGREIHVPLRAITDTADDKVSLFLTEQSVADVMALIAQQFNFQWRHVHDGYELTQSRDSQMQEDELRRKDIQAQLGSIASQLAQPPAVASTPRRELEAREREIAQRLVQLEETDDALRSSLQEEQDKIVEALHPGRASAAAIFRTLTPNQMAALLAERDVWLSRADGTLAPELADQVEAAETQAMTLARWKGFFDLFLKDHWPPGKTEVVVRIVDIIPSLSGPPPREQRHLRLLFLIPTGNEETHGWSGKPGFSVDARPGPSGLPPPETESDDPTLNHPVSWLLNPPGPAAEQNDTAVPGSSVAEADTERILRLSKVAEVLHRATGLEVVADSFTRARLAAGSLIPRRSSMQTAARVLNTLSEALQYTWHKEGNVLFLRSRSYYRDRIEEAPERIVGPWFERVHRTGATVDDLASLAQALTDGQVRGIDQDRDWYFPDVPASSTRELFESFYTSRQHLRFWASLSPGQRKQLARGAALPVAWMSLPQRRAFVAALQAQQPGPGGVRPLHSADELAFGGVTDEASQYDMAINHKLSYWLQESAEPTQQMVARVVSLIGEPEPQ